jgi:precorrin-3B synthase
MPTGDGLLVRFLPTDAITLDAVVALCAAARTHGNGTIEITARGSLQVRGLSARSAPAFASAVRALDIAASEGVSVITDPLADDPEVLVDTVVLATKVRAAIADAGVALAAKNSVVIDGGGRIHLDALAADVRLRATGPAQAPRFCVSVGGDAGCAIALGSVLPRDAAEIVVALLGVIAAQGANARAADILRRGGARSFRAVLSAEVESASPLPPRLVAEVIGRHPLRDGTFALGLALAFGHIHVDALAQLVRSDAARGVRGLRLAPDRALLLLGLTHPDAAGLEAEAERLGFIVRADDPRRRLVACAGKPACASGLIAARALAGEIAPHLPASADIVHISGCAKGCAHPRPAALTVVGTDRGCGLIEHGDPRAMPHRHVDDADIVAEIVRLAGRTPSSGHSPRHCAEGVGVGIVEA